MDKWQNDIKWRKMGAIEKKLLKQVVRASSDYGLLQSNDHIMVCMSGGKDSYAMLHLLQQIQKKAPFSFSLTAVNLDQGHPGFPGQVLEDHFVNVGVPYKMLKKDTYSIVLEKIPVGKAYCSLCSRLRRGILYNAAVELGCNKIALGHHRDDVIETLMLNILYSGQIKAMSPNYVSDDGRNTVIRPLVYCSEDDIKKLSAELDFPIIPCDLCGSQETLKRQKVKALISRLNEENPHVRGNMFNALRNVRPGQLLDPKLHPNPIKPISLAIEED
ncbi:MAG: tRNA 2-thiocytidine(32) synthetase TtcA [Myxococcota bacterium]|nr:tRNA 2-thiocytidine(32) synthetase TtcA [Myxococcota bacterium]